MTLGAIQAAGQYNLTEATLTNFDASKSMDIKTMFSLLSVTESIYDQSISGELIMSDAVGAKQFLPIIGEETLKITFTNNTFPKGEYSKLFRVYSITELKQDTVTKGEVYKLLFTSQESIDNESKRIQRSYKKAVVSDVVSDIFSLIESKKPLAVEKTQGATQFVVRSLTPFQSINLISTYAQSTSDPAPFFLFFENKTGFTFKNIKTLYNNPVKYQYEMSNQANDGATGASKGGVAPSFLKPFKMTQRTAFDMLDAVSSGMFASTVTGLDLLSKSAEDISFDYNTNFKKTSHISDATAYPLVSPSFKDVTSQTVKTVSSLNLRNNSKYYTQNTPDAINLSKTYEQYISARISTMVQQDYLVLELELPGNTDLQAGDVIGLKLPSTSDLKTSEVEKYHRYYTGSWLVKSLTHTLIANRFVTKVSIVKDCYASKIRSLTS